MKDIPRARKPRLNSASLFKSGSKKKKKTKSSKKLPGVGDLLQSPMKLKCKEIKLFSQGKGRTDLSMMECDRESVLAELGGCDPTESSLH